MIELEKLRKEAGISQRELMRRSRVDCAYISLAENRGFNLYPSQAQRIANALGWGGDPNELCREVCEDAEPAND